MNTSSTPTDVLFHPLQKIEQLIAKGELPKAATELNVAVRISPADPRIHLLGARLAEAANNPKAARESALRAVEKAPNWSIGVIELALLMGRQNQLKEALAYAERAVALAPHDLFILSRAIDVAHHAQHLVLALQLLRRAAELAPDNGSFQRLIARDLRLQGDYVQALAAYTALVEAHPTEAEPLLGRVQVALAMNNGALALQDADALVRLYPLNEEYRFWQELAQGKTPATQPADMVRALYDGYAANMFDQHVVRTLKYQLPGQVAQLILARYPDRALHVLDLGCGTGLLGLFLGRIQGALIGVDLSEAMVQQAARHQVYDRFHTVNLLDALTATPDALYHVITACDVFIYVGDLGQAIPNAHRVLRPDGHLIFSCESTAEGEADLVLRPTMRYAHRQSHIEALCTAAGFDSVSVQPTVLRMEGNQPVNGYIVVAHKPA